VVTRTTAPSREVAHMMQDIDGAADVIGVRVGDP